MERRPLRIGITCYPTYGGSGVVATEIGMAMARRGHQVHFICYDIPRRLDRFLENVYFHEVEVNDYPLFVFPPYPLSLASKMVEVTTYAKLDALHVHYAVPHATSAYLAKQILGKDAPKVITTLHGTDITLVGNDRSYLPITRFSINESDHVTTPSKYLRLATYDKLNLSPDTPIEVIANFIDTKKYAPADEKSSEKLRQFLGGCALTEKVITHVSNFRTVKRVRDVIQVFAKVAPKISSHLFLIGDGPERSGAEALSRELGLEERICFLGKQLDFIPLLQHTDVFLLPSESESFGLAALEAMACGAPVVCTNVQGLPELINNGVDGFLSDLGDIDSMSEQVLKILQDDSLREKMSKAAREKAVTLYEQEMMMNRYEDMYYHVLDKPRSMPATS